MEQKSWIIIDGFKIVGGDAVLAYINCTDNQFLNMDISGSFGNAIILYNNVHRNLIKGNRLYNNVQMNFNPRGKAQTAGTDWAGGLTIGGAGPNTNNVVEDNYIYWNHGEGVAIGPQDGNTGTIVRRNVIADNWSVNLYCDGCKSAIFDSNVVYTSTEAYNWANPNGYAAMRPAGIAVSNEDINNMGVDGLTITNNIVVGHGQAGFVLFGCEPGSCSGSNQQNGISNHYFKNIALLNNTFVANDSGIAFSPGANIFTDITVNNNIVDRHTNTSGATVQYKILPTSRSFSNNIYNGTATNTFYLSASAYSFNNFVSQIGESGSSFANPSLVNSSASGPRLWNDPSLPPITSIPSRENLIAPYLKR